MSGRLKVFADVLTCLSLISLIGAACDPLGNAAQVAALQPTSTATRAPIPPPTMLITLPLSTPDTNTTPTNAPSTTDQSTAAATMSVACIQGQVLDATFDSKITHGTVTYRVYLPPCYWQTNRRYPYIILLHGSDGDQTEWTDRLHIDLALDQGIASG